ncbi:MAG: hypothetical protein ACREIA_24500 [Opitutaceae bacterium]
MSKTAKKSSPKSTAVAVVTAASTANTKHVSYLSETKPVDLEKIDVAQIRDSFAFEADAWGARAREMLIHVDALKVDRAKKCTLLGIFLYRVKGELGHGQFGAWMEKHFTHPYLPGNPRATIRTAQHFMALARQFCRSQKVMLPELITGQQLALDLPADGKAAQAVEEKLDKFVGGSGVTDLLLKHKILKRGRPAGSKDDGKAGETPDEAPEADAAGAAFQNAYNALKEAEGVLLSDLVWADLALDAALNLEATLKSFVASFHEKVLEMRNAHAGAAVSA